MWGTSDRPCDHGSRGWRDTATNQKMPGMAGYLQKLGTGKEGIFPGAPEEMVYKESLSPWTSPFTAISFQSRVCTSHACRVCEHLQYEAWAQVVVLAVFCYLNCHIKKRIGLTFKSLGLCFITHSHMHLSIQQIFTGNITWIRPWVRPGAAKMIPESLMLRDMFRQSHTRGIMLWGP